MLIKYVSFKSRLGLLTDFLRKLLDGGIIFHHNLCCDELLDGYLRVHVVLEEGDGLSHPFSVLV